MSSFLLRTGASGSSSVDLNKSLDNAMPKILNGGARFTTLPPLCPPIKEEVPFPPPKENGGPQHNSTPNILDMSEVSFSNLSSKSEKISRDVVSKLC